MSVLSSTRIFHCLWRANMLVLLLFPLSSFAETELRSGPQKVALLELYTSQGCSSCPPADQWISRLVDQPGLWTNFTPLAFHVDYWDYIGWSDRFAEPAFSARQRRYEQEGSISLVYTPEFVLSGTEWRRWRTQELPVHAPADGGLLSAKVQSGIARVNYSPPAKYRGALVANIALLGFGLESDVVAGENSGRKLTNDFVVLGLERESMTALNEGYEVTVRVPPGKVDSSRQAIVVWVASPGNLSPMQSAGGWYVE